MNIGLCLCGGGAKGAYQAGVIKALYDRGINKFNAISGTSIGAVNGYFIFTNNVVSFLGRKSCIFRERVVLLPLTGLKYNKKLIIKE